MDSEFQKTMERQKRAEELAEKVMCLARDNIVVNMRFRSEEHTSELQSQR